MGINIGSNFDEVLLEVRMMNAHLQNKKEVAMKQICERLCELIKEFSTGVISDDVYYVSEIYEGNKKTYDYMPMPKISGGFDVSFDYGANTGIVYVQGKEIFFIEFGAGMYVDNNDKLKDYMSFPTARGSYGKHHGLDDYWFFRNEYGELMMAKGTPSSKPVMYALEQIRKEIPEILRGVFE